MLTVSNNKRYLLKDGKHFPYLADTAWSMLQRLTKEEIVFYLDKRKQQGFNAVQVSAIAEDDGIRKPNRYGFVPFMDENVYHPDEAYFSLVQFLLTEAGKRDMVVVLLPTWGDKFNKREGKGPEIFNPENAFVYGEYLASKVVGEFQNVIFMLGGDRPLEKPEHFAVINAMAKGLRAGEKCYHLMTYHPNGEASSASFVPNNNNIDFHSVQSSHDFGGFHSETLIADTLSKENKPCLDAECFYEDFPIGFNLAWNYRLCEDDIIDRLYKNLLCGAAGHTYGHQSVWNFVAKADAEYLYDWKSALDRPMANKMQFMNRLIGAVDILSLTPSDISKNSLSAMGKGFALVYCPKGKATFVETKKYFDLAYTRFFNPKTGEFTSPILTENGKLTFVNPYDGDGILLITANG